MPIYEYRCEKCGREFEEWQKFSDTPVEACAECGGKARRLISQSSFVLKGTGWYVTDYARKDTGGGKAASKAKETSESSSAASSSSSAGES
jgi:putative FmdB family regulatory protein